MSASVPFVLRTIAIRHNVRWLESLRACGLVIQGRYKTGRLGEPPSPPIIAWPAFVLATFSLAFVSFFLPLFIETDGIKKPRSLARQLKEETTPDATTHGPTVVKMRAGVAIREAGQTVMLKWRGQSAQSIVGVSKIAGAKFYLTLTAVIGRFRGLRNPSRNRPSAMAFSQLFGHSPKIDGFSLQVSGRLFFTKKKGGPLLPFYVKDSHRFLANGRKVG